MNTTGNILEEMSEKENMFKVKMAGLNNYMEKNDLNKDL